ncbi:DMT family transporter [Thalassobius sp. I31.1]|uniref:DMT family transporter n=1 Tax=Thalassobius sp. I31.1 TaxID=2109912 RepID=UPI001E5B67F3|nr:DMT family transporter [Thalassobius sp. I31.1]
MIARVKQGNGLLFLVLLGCGMVWGLSFPLNKIAVSEGYRDFGIIFWNQFICAALLSLICWQRGVWPGFKRDQIRLYLAVMLCGTLLPNWASYTASVYLPAGVVALLISLVPMFAFPIALALGSEKFNWRRFAGLLTGMAAVLLIAGPEASLPDRAMVVFVPLALIAPFLYGLESNLVAKWGDTGEGPVRVLLGASILGSIASLPIALMTGTFITPPTTWAAPDFAIVMASLINVIAYTGYVWLVGRAGAVFSAQVAYIVTASGLLWSMLLLSESYSSYIWIALALMMAGLFLVQPRGNASAVGQ